MINSTAFCSLLKYIFFFAPYVVFMTVKWSIFLYISGTSYHGEAILTAVEVLIEFTAPQERIEPSRLQSAQNLKRIFIGNRSPIPNFVVYHAVSTIKSFDK